MNVLKELRIFIILLAVSTGLYFGTKKADAIAQQQETRMINGSVDFNGSGNDIIYINGTEPGQLYSLNVFTSGLAELRIRNGADERFEPERVSKYSNIYILRGDGPYTVEIDTDAPWNMRAKKIESFTGDGFSSSGNGYGITPVFQIKEGIYSLNCKGSGAVSAFLYCDGVQTELLRKAEEPISVELPLGHVGENGVIVVYANGDWNIEYSPYPSVAQ